MGYNLAPSTNQFWHSWTEFTLMVGVVTDDVDITVSIIDSGAMSIEIIVLSLFFPSCIISSFSKSEEGGDEDNNEFLPIIITADDGEDGDKGDIGVFVAVVAGTVVMKTWAVSVKIGWYKPMVTHAKSKIPNELKNE